MNQEDYPALYQAADAASLTAQYTFLRCIKTYSVLLIIGAALSLRGINSRNCAIVAALFFLVTLFLSILMATKRYERIWYKCRALAESVKTSTWRYMMRTEPYEDAPTISIPKAEFRKRLNEILSENRDLAQYLGGEISVRDQITERMHIIRTSTLFNRKDFYKRYRIENQREWYANKSRYNISKGLLWFIAIVLLQALAVGTVLLRIAYPGCNYLTTEVFVVAAGAVLTWTQVKRFQELAAAYGLAAHEIGIIEGKLGEIETEEEFSDFVKDSENAFSREHTQWAARRDS